MLLRLAIRILIHNLRKDRDYWHSWQSNIAVCMQDVLKDDLKISFEQCHTATNKGACRFLELLTRNRKVSEKHI